MSNPQKYSYQSTHVLKNAWKQYFKEKLENTVPAIPSEF